MTAFKRVPKDNYSLYVDVFQTVQYRYLEKSSLQVVILISTGISERYICKQLS